MSRIKGTHRVVTAAWTECGAPVYLQATARRWTQRLQEAEPLADAAWAEQLLQWANDQEQHVCDAYVIGVDLDERGCPVALTQRERIRATGPGVIPAGASVSHPRRLQQRSA